MALGFSLSTALITIAIFWVLWRGAKRLFGQHPLNNVPGPNSPSFYKGNLGQLFNPKAWQFHQYLADNFQGVAKIHGMWGDKQLYVCDPKALHNILVKDQYIYEEAAWFIHGNKLIFGDGLLSTLGDQHRKQRKMLNPVFSSRHLQDMIPIFYEITYKLRDAIWAQVREGPREIDMLHWMSRTALELIGQSGLGHSFDDLGQGRPNEYTEAVKNLSPVLFRLVIIRRILPYVSRLGPPSFRRFILKLIPSSDIQKACEMVDIMDNTSVKIFQSKKKAWAKGDEAVLEQIGRGKDIMSILLKANLAASEEDRLPENELIGQMTTLIFAAMDTTSGALSRILHLLAQNPDVQTRLRKEITESRADGGDIDYNGLVNLPYLDAVIRETLRFYPPVPMVHRIARKDMVLPLSKPIVGNDGTEMSEILVPKGTSIAVSILRANREPEIWGADAYVWKPERWMSPLPASVTDAHYPAVYANMMTFIGGSRACIGFKFSQLEMKVVLSLLLESFAFSESKKEVAWSMGGIVSPTVLNPTSNSKPQMPLIVTSLGAGKRDGS